MTYENENPYAGYDSNGASPQELLARLTALQSHISSTVTKLGEAESKIDQQAEQILLTVRKDEIISAINLSPEAIDIISSRINLYGAVTVLSDITGELGTITAGDIFGVNIYGGYISSETDIDIGQDLYIGVVSNGGGYFDTSTLHFGDYAGISAKNMGGLSEISLNAVTIKINSGSTLSLTGVNIQGAVIPGYATSQDVSDQVWAGNQSVMDWVTQNFVHK